MSNAPKFLIGMAAGALGLIAALAVLFVWLDTHDQLKAPSFANRLSFDEKMRKLREQPLRDVEVLFVGSSTTLHGLDSAVLRAQLGVEGDLLNLGVQDIRVNQVKFLAEVFLNQYPTTKHVVMVSTLLDYKNCGEVEPDFFHPDDVLDYVTNGWPELYYQFRYLDIGGVWKRSGQIHHLRNTDSNLESVHFSPSGSVLLDVPRDGVIDRVWDGDPIVLDPPCYDSLRALAQDLDQRKIAFTYVIAPMRPGYLDHRDPEGHELAEHRRLVAQYLDGTGAYIVDAHDALDMPEEAFFDAYHMKPDEARALTRFIGERIVARSHEPQNHDLAGPSADLSARNGTIVKEPGGG